MKTRTKYVLTVIVAPPVTAAVCVAIVLVFDFFLGLIGSVLDIFSWYVWLIAFAWIACGFGIANLLWDDDLQHDELPKQNRKAHEKADELDANAHT